MQKSYIPVFIFIFIVAILVASCTRNVDLIDQDVLSASVSQNANTIDLSKCKIRRIYQIGGNNLVSALFSYNKAGNPYSILYSLNGTGSPNHYFIYDSKNRLREWRQTFADGSFITEHHKYGYVDNGPLINSDTTLINVGIIFEYITTFFYDSQGRVIRETIKNTVNPEGPLESTRNPTYTYDSRGNLGVLGWKSSYYDNKINPLRQSSVFQFVMRNYSMNNAAVQPKYNSLGLPLSINPSNDFFFNNQVTTKIVYDCQ